jgi:hypothetical protein
MINFSDAINQEEVLDFALTHICSVESWQAHPIAERIVMWYILNEFTARYKDIDDLEAIHERYSELMADHLIMKLSKDGYVDADINDNGDIVYTVTQKAKDQVNEC